MKQEFKLRDYDWNVCIYYAVDLNHKREIMDKLVILAPDQDTKKQIETNLNKATKDTGFTYSNFIKKVSIVVIHKASNLGEFINTYEHEKNHLEMHICEALDINPYSEEAANLSGKIGELIINDFLRAMVQI